MKTSLYLTDVVMLRNEGDTVSFWSLEIPKTSRGFEVKNSAELVQSLLHLYGLETSKPTANPGRRSAVMDLTTAIPLDGHDYPNFRRAVGKLIFMAGMQFAIRHLSTQVLNPNREQAHSETVDTQCNVQRVTMRNRSLKQTATSLSSCEAEFHAASACGGELLSLAELFKELHYNVSVRLEMGSVRHVTFSREEDLEDSSTVTFDAWRYNNGSEKNLYRQDAWIRKRTGQGRSFHEVFVQTTNAVRSRGLQVMGSHGRQRDSEQRILWSSV